MVEVVVTTGALSRAKLQLTNIQFFTGRMPFLSPNQQCQSTEGKYITFHGIAYPKLNWSLTTLYLTTNSSWLPWGRVGMPLTSPLMPVPPTLLLQRLIRNGVQYKHRLNGHFQGEPQLASSP